MSVSQLFCHIYKVRYDQKHWKSVSLLSSNTVCLSFSCSMHTATCFRVAPQVILHSLSHRQGEVQTDLAYRYTGFWVALHSVTWACTNRHAWNMWRQTRRKMTWQNLKNSPVSGTPSFHLSSHVNNRLCMCMCVVSIFRIYNSMLWSLTPYCRDILMQLLLASHPLWIWMHVSESVSAWTRAPSRDREVDVN